MVRRRSLVAGNYDEVFLTDLVTGQLLRIETRRTTIWVTTLAVSKEAHGWIEGLMVQVTGGGMESVTRHDPLKIAGRNHIKKGDIWPVVAGEDDGGTGTITQLTIVGRG